VTELQHLRAVELEDECADLRATIATLTTERDEARAKAAYDPDEDGLVYPSRTVETVGRIYTSSEINSLVATARKQALAEAEDYVRRHGEEELADGIAALAAVKGDGE
jgi:hypothetical protein